MRKYIVFCCFVLLQVQVNASHYMGGEITWACVNDGRYIFTMKVYRECNGIQFGQIENIQVFNHPSVTNIPMTRILQTDISPQCNVMGPHITCDNAPQPNKGAVEEIIYTSDTISLTGVPPSQGWIFSWGTCCRNPCTNIINSSSKNWLLRAVMYKYTPPGSSTPLPANQCFDNAPVFAQRPVSVLCTGYPYNFNYSAYDIDGDVMTFEWASPLEGVYQPIVQYAPGYSATSPLPGIVHHPNNIPGTINPQTGEISLKSFTQGAFQTVQKVSTYRNNQLIAEVFREIQMVLLACDSSNSAPTVYSSLTPIPIPTGTFYADTVNVGDSVSYDFAVSDFDLLPDSTSQLITLTFTGGQLGIDDSTGCANPPCAIILPAAKQIGINVINATFKWTTDCAHLPSGAILDAQMYSSQFQLTAQDDFCPIPSYVFKTLKVFIRTFTLAPPDLAHVTYDSIGEVTLTWTPIIDTSGRFLKYMIYHKSGFNGVFSILDSVSDINQNTYSTTFLNNDTTRSFYVRTIFGCSGPIPYFLSSSSDTLVLLGTNSTQPTAYNDETSFYIYPNPATDIFYIKPSDKIEKISILNTLGQTVQVISEDFDKGLPLNFKEKGLFIIHVQRANKNYYLKLIH